MKMISLLTALALSMTMYNAEATVKATTHKAVKQVDDINIQFSNDVHAFTEQERNEISKIIIDSTNEVRALLPQLTGPIKVQVNAINRNIDIVGGVFGRAEAPGEVSYHLSTQAKGGVVGAANAALKSSVYHELHHLAMGWTMIDNKYGNPAGIPISTVNEGLAGVFAETYTNQYFAKAFDYPENVHNWLLEIMELPKNANYSHWISGMHPDGRMAIGYRLGRYVVHQAQQKSGKDIIEVSQLHPNEILNIVLEK